MFRRAGLFLAILALSSCRVEESTRPRTLDLQVPSLGISDGANGGNSEFFFYPPLAADPAGHENLDAGASNPGLAPYAVICKLADPTGTAYCLDDVTPLGNPGGIPLTYATGGEFYRNNWKSSESGLQVNSYYRIEVFAVPLPTNLDGSVNRSAVDAAFIATYRYGYRDIDPDDGPNTGACGGEAFCKIQNGSNVAIKVRIERFASCPELDERNCASAFVPSNQETNLQQPSSNQITIPGQSTDFFLNFDVCTAEEEAAVDAAIDLPTFGPCFKTETPFTGTLSTPAILSICQVINFVPAEYQAQKEQITLHHFDTEGGTAITKVEALPEAHSCPPQAASATVGGPFRMLARAVRNSLASLIHPRTLYATVALDVGGGGATDDLSSLFKLALPGKFEFENPADALRVALTGSAVTLKARVTDLVGNPVYRARVHWNVSSSPGSPDPGGASLTPPPPATGYTDANGIAQVVLNVAPLPGINIVHATGKGIADAREADALGTGCSLPPSTATTASCNGPRTAGPHGPFDPFIPLNQTLDLTLGTESVQLASGTRLEFTVIGCEKGYGTPVAINGILSAGEWDCAQTQEFPVSLSGGAATATLYWMNDANNMYMAVVVPGTGRENSLRIDWDADGSSSPAPAQGSRALGDDIWEVIPGASTTTTDRYIDSKCLTSSQSGCGLSDGALKNQTVAGFSNNQGGNTVYELSHPLNTGDTKSGTDPLKVDIAAVDDGQTLGMYITLRLGSGAQGNTQWPGFLKYHPVTIIK